MLKEVVQQDFVATTIEGRTKRAAEVIGRVGSSVVVARVGLAKEDIYSQIEQAQIMVSDLDYTDIRLDEIRLFLNMLKARGFNMNYIKNFLRISVKTGVSHARGRMSEHSEELLEKCGEEFKQAAGAQVVRDPSKLLLSGVSKIYSEFSGDKYCLSQDLPEIADIYVKLLGQKGAICGVGKIDAMDKLLEKTKVTNVVWRGDSYIDSQVGEFLKQDSRVNHVLVIASCRDPKNPPDHFMNADVYTTQDQRALAEVIGGNL